MTEYYVSMKITKSLLKGWGHTSMGKDASTYYK